ncbi:arylesterase [Serratia microhaemolytica]|uniref:arylesterase n=1 Tax=Serratia microhaemolytica TaxID=2675110 RepID=UPI000FDD7593|nr:arylesterase [Serratia microhaemolytica]
MKKLVAALLIGAVVVFIVNLLIDAGVFYQVEEHGTEQCQKIGAIPGVEDIAPLPHGDALASSVDQYHKTSGALYYLKQGDTPQRLSGDYPTAFFPHGIDVWQQDGETWVYVVNHRPEGDYIEVFRFDRAEMRLAYQPTMSRSVGNNINDIAVIDQSRWLLTRDHHWSGLAGRFEDYLRLPLARVLLVDEHGLHTLLDRLHFANGIYYNQQRGLLYVAETTTGAVSSWAWHPNGKAPVLVGRLTGLHGVDNIIPKGDQLLVAAHPQLLKLAAYQKDPQARSPSMVWRLKISPHGELHDAEIFYQSDGRALAAISVAAPLGKHVIMGSVFDNGLLLCQAQQ